jgi:hypothetical protein
MVFWINMIAVGGMMKFYFKIKATGYRTCERDISSYSGLSYVEGKLML